jgi:hypothetical protein
MKCRLFDILVEPVMSYASHVWGPELFHGMLFNSARCYSSAADKTHWAYLRIMAGMPKSVAIDNNNCFFAGPSHSANLSLLMLC